MDTLAALTRGSTKSAGRRRARRPTVREAPTPWRRRLRPSRIRGCARRSSRPRPASGPPKASRRCSRTCARTMPACAPARSMRCARCPRLRRRTCRPCCRMRIRTCACSPAISPANLPQRRSHPAALRSARGRNRGERLRRGGRRSGRDRRTGSPAGPGAMRRPLPRRPVPGVRHQGRGRADRAGIPPTDVTDPAPLTEEEFRRLCEFLYRRTGMVFTETKRYYVERRITERMAATGATTFAELLRPAAQRHARRGRSSSSMPSRSTKPISIGKTTSSAA